MADLYYSFGKNGTRKLACGYTIKSLRSMLANTIRDDRINVKKPIYF